MIGQWNNYMMIDPIFVTGKRPKYLWHSAQSLNTMQKMSLLAKAMEEHI